MSFLSRASRREERPKIMTRISRKSRNPSESFDFLESSDNASNTNSKVVASTTQDAVRFALDPDKLWMMFQVQLKKARGGCMHLARHASSLLLCKQQAREAKDQDRIKAQDQRCACPQNCGFEITAHSRVDTHRCVHNNVRCIRPPRAHSSSWSSLVVLDNVVLVRDLALGDIQNRDRLGAAA